jgi:hypothetical protein
VLDPATVADWLEDAGASEANGSRHPKPLSAARE